MDTRTVARLAEIMNEHALTELEIDEQGSRIRMTRAASSAPVIVPPTADNLPTTAADAEPAPARNPEPVDTPEPAAAPAAETFITSPIVGTFYISSSPDGGPLVQEGDRVETGQTVCFIEAMKIMNEVKAESPCIIKRILLKNKSAVEFGTPMFEITPL